jgi:alkaline phosphatase
MEHDNKGFSKLLKKQRLTNLHHRNMRLKITLIVFILSATSRFLTAQYTTQNAHSHNDYANSVPFYLAYNNHFGSIEADIWAVDGDLLVAHSFSEIRKEKSLDSLYLLPIIRTFRQNGGKPWNDVNSTFQLLIDIKTKPEPALSLLVEKLKKYPEVFDHEMNKYAVTIVITGNRPDPSEYLKYPHYIFFDGLLKLKYTPSELSRVPLFSENIIQFSSWNGKGLIPEKEKIRLTHVTDSVHSLNKKIRFWNCPDNENAWATYKSIGIDYLNTDHITELAEYLGRNKTEK